MRRIIPAAFGVLALALAAGACSSDSEEVEDEIVKALERDQQVEAENVVCPEDADAKEGNEFDCTFEAQNQEWIAHVVFRSDTEFEIEVRESGSDTNGTEEDTDASS